MKTARKAPQIGLRLPVDLKQWLEERATANHRSLNGEATALLERYRQQEANEKAPARKE